MNIFKTIKNLFKKNNNITDRNKNIYDNIFWKKRIEDAVKNNNLRYSVFKAPQNIWIDILNDHVNIIYNIIDRESNILDAGCGYGRLVDLLDKKYYNGKYVGVDQSPDFIEIAKELYPDKEFYCLDLKKLPFEDNTFDISICCSLMIMIVQNLGWFEWEKIQNELLRVSKNGILCLEYGCSDTNTSSDTYYLIRKNKI